MIDAGVSGSVAPDRREQLGPALGALDAGDVATTATPTAESLEAHGWHRCASLVDPSPGDGRSMVDKCRVLASERPRTQEFLDLFYAGDCSMWADAQQFIIDTMGAPACSESMRLSMLWRKSVLSDDEMQQLGHVSLC